MPAFLAALATACGAPKVTSAPIAVIGAPTQAPRPTPTGQKPQPPKTTKDEQVPAAPMVLPCPHDGADSQAAQARIFAIDAKVRALAASAPAAAIAKEIDALLEGPCFRLAPPPSELAPDSGLSLRTFWDGGGRWWLENQLELDGKRAYRTFIVPPSARRTLAADVNKTSPLLPLLCPADAAMPNSTSACGSETLGWMYRAEQSYVRAAEAHRSHFLDFDAGEPPPSRPGCERAAKDADPKEAYDKYSTCMTLAAARADAPPLGRFSAPKDGWLVIRGTRGHHSYCDGISAFDLATGAFYGVKMCAGINMSAPASAGGAPQIQASVGRVPLDALREAALFILLTDVSQPNIVLSSVGYQIPENIVVQAPENLLGTISLGGFGWSSNRTVLEVSWVQHGVGRARTTVHWPDADDALHAHATELLTVAEQGFVAGCAPARLPKFPWNALGPRLAESTYSPAIEDKPQYDDLRDALDALRNAHPKGC